MAPPGVGFSTQPVVDVERTQMEVAPPIMGARSPRLGPCTAACVERVAEVSPILLVPRLRRVFGKRLLERRALLRTGAHPPVHSGLPGLSGFPGRAYCPSCSAVDTGMLDHLPDFMIHRRRLPQPRLVGAFQLVVAENLRVALLGQPLLEIGL